MSEDLASLTQRLFEGFGAVVAAPDDVTVGEAADDTLRQLDVLLAADAGTAPGRA